MYKIKKEWYRPPLDSEQPTPYDNPNPEVNKTLEYIAQVTNTSKDKVTEILKVYFLYSVEQIRKTYKPLS